jgi:hypothetical protein
VSVLLLFKNFDEDGSIAVFMNNFLSGLLLVGFGKLLMMIEHFNEKQLEQLSRVNDELSRLRYEREKESI